MTDAERFADILADRSHIDCECDICLLIDKLAERDATVATLRHLVEVSNQEVCELAIAKNERDARMAKLEAALRGIAGNTHDDIAADIAEEALKNYHDCIESGSQASPRE